MNKELSDSELQTVIGGLIASPSPRPPIIIILPGPTCPPPTTTRPKKWF
jgi:bacteriocin-like protein